MGNIKSKKRNWRKWLGRGLRWLFGIIVLYCVFNYIDFAKFKQNIVESDLRLIGLGLIHSPLLILIAALRWRFLLDQYHKINLSIKYVVSQYWIGLTLGFFTPASIGLDAYRVVVSGRRLGEYTINAAIILAEEI